MAGKVAEPELLVVVAIQLECLLEIRLCEYTYQLRKIVLLLVVKKKYGHKVSDVMEYQLGIFLSRFVAFLRCTGSKTHCYSY